MGAACGDDFGSTETGTQDAGPYQDLIEGQAAVRTLAAGSAGFIGLRGVQALLAQGYEVTVCDGLSSGTLDNPGQARWLLAFQPQVTLDASLRLSQSCTGEVQ